MRALAQLPSRQRRTVVLRYFAELSVEETASDLGCSTGTVKSQTSAALRKLDALLSPTFNDTTTHGTGERHG
jgi:RNA polymerase sigma factor (sigma-70 family)